MTDNYVTNVANNNSIRLSDIFSSLIGTTAQSTSNLFDNTPLLNSITNTTQSVSNTQYLNTTNSNDYNNSYFTNDNNDFIDFNLSGVDSNWNQNNPLNFPILNNLNQLNTTEYNQNLQTSKKENPTYVENTNLPYGNSIFAFNKATTPQHKLTEQKLYNDYGIYDTSKYSGVSTDSNGNVTFLPINNQNNKQLHKTKNVVNGLNTNNPLLQSLILANKFRNQQLDYATNLQHNQLDYLKQHDAQMMTLQNLLLSQQRSLANEQLSKEMSIFNKNYDLQKSQFDFNKQVQSTLLDKTMEQYESEKKLSQSETDRFMGRHINL